MRESNTSANGASRKPNQVRTKRQERATERRRARGIRGVATIPPRHERREIACRPRVKSHGRPIADWPRRAVESRRKTPVATTTPATGRRPRRHLRAAAAITPRRDGAGDRQKDRLVFFDADGDKGCDHGNLTVQTSNAQNAQSTAAGASAFSWKSLNVSPWSGGYRKRHQPPQGAPIVAIAVRATIA